MMSNTSTYLCDTHKLHDMKAADWIDRIEVIRKHLPLIDKEVDKLSKREIVHKLISNNIPELWERDYILKDSGQGKTLKAVKKILKTIKKAHAKDKMEEESSMYKEGQRNCHRSHKKNMRRLHGHNHLLKDCPNNPSSKKYNGTHYSKIWKQEKTGASSQQDEDKSTKSAEKRSESKSCSQKSHHHYIVTQQD